MKRTTNASATAAGPGLATSKADHAYDSIREAIQRGDYHPGERLVIQRLAEQLGVSVVPIREAIRRLESEGYVNFKRNVGATVTTIDLSRYPETIEAVAALEGIALGLAAPHLTVADLRKAREINDRLRGSLSPFDPAKFSQLNRRFHQILFRACPNRHILGILEREWALLETTRRSAFQYIPERAAESIDEHDVLLDMIGTGRGSAEIERFSRDHRMATARLIIEQVSDRRAAGGDDAPSEPIGVP
jgi:DNA-binding GntR family transcriptional regulator